MRVAGGLGPAEQFLAIALKHPEVLRGEVANVDGHHAVELVLNVEMPLPLMADRCSPNGVLVTEPVRVVIPPDFPWTPPVFFLRDGFPRALPHLQPDPLTAPPRPCLVDGSHQEVFAHRGLIEFGIFYLVDQLALWLRRAAVSALNDPLQGWEPMLRRDLVGWIAIDTDAARGRVTRDGGFAVLTARYLRIGGRDTPLLGGATTYMVASNRTTPLREGGKEFSEDSVKGNERMGRTVVAVLWPGKLPNGELIMAPKYLPESVQNLADLQERATEIGCRPQLDTFLRSLERAWTGYALAPAVPVGVVLCARRPFNLINSCTAIELLPYVFDMRAERTKATQFVQGPAKPVAPAGIREILTPTLLRTVSGLHKVRPKLSILGCGSVGSKLALHAARAGQVVAALSDSSVLQPHNMARHSLLPAECGSAKATALAAAVAALGPTPHAHLGDLTRDLRDPEVLRRIVPSTVGAVINTTASQIVREALVTAASAFAARVFEAGLFGRGRAAYLLFDGPEHNPTSYDLMAELYATATDPYLRKLMFDPREGISEVQIGQGCSSLTMPMEDAVLSSMTAGLYQEAVRLMEAPPGAGEIVVAVADRDTPGIKWTRQPVEAFVLVGLEGCEDWHVRISPRVLADMRAEARRWTTAETGGVLIGQASARLRTVVITGLLPAPRDSIRSADKFVLGTAGLQEAIETRHRQSGSTLYDVGTWHSHLSDAGPSALDWETARKLASERAPPSVLLIVCPTQLHALSGNFTAP